MGLNAIKICPIAVFDLKSPGRAWISYILLDLIWVSHLAKGTAVEI